VHFARLANTMLKDEESARDNHVLACNFAKYLPIFNIHLIANLQRNLPVIFLKIGYDLTEL